MSLNIMLIYHYDFNVRLLSTPPASILKVIQKSKTEKFQNKILKIHKIIY